MRSRIQAVVLPSEPGEFRDDVRRIFQELARETGEAPTGECAPALDILETDEALEVVMDLPGVSSDTVRVVTRGAAVILAGYKPPRRARTESSFHLVERGYGRFARIVQLSSSCDTSRATATLENGELRVRLPRIADRRGRAVRIAVSQQQAQA